MMKTKQMTTMMTMFGGGEWEIDDDVMVISPSCELEGDKRASQRRTMGQDGRMANMENNNNDDGDDDDDDDDDDGDDVDDNDAKGR